MISDTERKAARWDWLRQHAVFDYSFEGPRVYLHLALQVERRLPGLADNHVDGLIDLEIAGAAALALIEGAPVSSSGGRD